LFSKAREELKKKRGEEYSYPILAFHGTAVTNILPICENGFKMPSKLIPENSRKQFICLFSR